METKETSTKRVLKNTFYLYVRKIVTIVITLFATRVLLDKLGIEGFGLYGLIGSIVAVFGALRGTFSSSIQRYISVEKGVGNICQINKIFCVGIKIHIWASLIFFVMAEIAGLIFLPILNLSSTLLPIAWWVLQFSILTTIVSFLTIPYDALLVAYEKFNTYAVISIIESVLKLVIIYLLGWSPIDRVITYSALLFFVSVIVRGINYIYCRRQFAVESKYSNVSEKKLVKDMCCFAGWNFLGYSGSTISHSGINFVFNMFGGVVVNAARTISYQVMQAVQIFVEEMTTGFRPQSTIEYAKGNYSNFNKLMYLNTKASFILFVTVGFPIVIFTPSILKIWLGEIPPYAVEFVRTIFLYGVVRTLHGPLDTLFKVEGNLKAYQICELTCFLLNLPFSWSMLKLGFPLYSVFIVITITEIVNTIGMIIIAEKICQFNIRDYINKVIVKIIIAFAVLFGVFCFFISFIQTQLSFVKTILFSIITCILSLFISGMIILSHKELFAMRNIVVEKLRILLSLKKY